jgi:hypothetical protein
MSSHAKDEVLHDRIEALFEGFGPDGRSQALAGNVLFIIVWCCLDDCVTARTVGAGGIACSGGSSLGRTGCSTVEELAGRLSRSAGLCSSEGHAILSG